MRSYIPGLDRIVLFLLSVCFFVPFFCLLFVSVTQSFLGDWEEKNVRDPAR